VTIGRFITLEGIEGAGKSTVARYAHDWLSARGISVRLTREPGGTPLAERVRQIVLERGGEQLPAATETLLMFAARNIHVENLIRPALGRGEWIVCDRFTDATRAYQGAGRGVSRDLIEQLAVIAHHDLQPHRTLLLDLPVTLGLERAQDRSGVGADRFEAESVQFFERIREAYLELARAEPARFRVIDASRTLPEVQSQVTDALQEVLGEAA